MTTHYATTAYPPREPSADVPADGRHGAQSGSATSKTGAMLFGLGLASSVEFYTFDAVNLALPDMAGSFGVSRDQASWVLTAYSSAMFFGIPLSIWLAAHLRHRRFILGSVALFALSSLACSLSSSFEGLLIWRAVEGFAGAGLTMWWRASVYMLMQGSQRSNSLMRISVMLYLATSAGLLFAGFITDAIHWRLIFLPNVLLAIGAIWLVARNYPDIAPSDDPRVQHVDKLGIVLIGLAIVCTQVVLSRGEIDDWFGSGYLRALAWIAGIALAAFICWETSSRNPHPILRLHLIRQRPVIAAACLGIFAGVVLSGSLYALPEFLRGVFPGRLSATDTGLVMCTYALTAAAIRPLVTLSIAKFGQRKMVTFAFSMLVISMLVMSKLVTLDTPVGYYAIPLIMYAFCLAPMLSSVGGGTVAKMAPEHQLDAVAIYMTFRQLGTSLGVTLVSIVLERRETLHSARLFDHLHAGMVQLRAWTHSVSDILVARDGRSPADAARVALKMLGEEGAHQAATLAYADAFQIMAVVGLAALLFVPLMPPSAAAK